MNFGPQEQQEWAREMRERVPRPAGERWHQPTHIFSNIASEVLGERVEMWRDLTPQKAEAVLETIRVRYPRRRDESREVWDEDAKAYVPIKETA